MWDVQLGEAVPTFTNLTRTKTHTKDYTRTPKRKAATRLNWIRQKTALFEP